MESKQKKKPGPKLIGSEPMVSISITLLPKQIKKLRANGGSAYIRRLLDDDQLAIGGN